MNPLKVARVARYDEILTQWKASHMMTEMTSRKALGPGTFEDSGREADWTAWEEAINRELEIWVDLKEAWKDLTEGNPNS